MSQIERLKQRKIELQQHWDDLSQKITSLRQDLAFETRSDERLRLRKNINQNEADRNQIGQELDNVEKELSNIANLEGSSSLETFIPTISSGIHEKPQSATSSMTQRSTVQLEPTAEVTQVKRSRPQVFLSYNKANEYLVEQLAQRLKGDARISFWFEPWHSIPGKTTLDEKEKVLLSAQSLAVFIGGNSAQLEKEWQSKEKDAAITIQVEDRSDFRVIPVLLPGPVRPNKSDLPPFLKLFNWVEFQTMDDEQAFKRLLAGILGIPPIKVEGYLETRKSEELQREQIPSIDGFTQGHALIIGIANYPQLKPLPSVVLNDARDLSALLTDPTTCGYPQTQVVQLLDQDASGNGIRSALVDLAQRTDVDDTVVIYFSGHGAYEDDGKDTGQYILPFDFDPTDLSGTAIRGDEMTSLLRNIKAGRLLVLFDSCHSGGAGDPKGPLPQLKTGLGEGYYQRLTQGRGRVVIASSRPEEYSWVLEGMNNSLFTHYLLEALRGQAKMSGSNYVRVFNIFRHVSDHVPLEARKINVSQHPIFKAAALEDDFPIALVKR